MTNYGRQQLLNWVINLIPGLFLCVGGVGGVALGIWQFRIGSPVIDAWVRAKGGWELSAFGAFGTMSGFGMAALALIATLSAHERGKESVDSNSGRQMVRFIVRSTWAWLFPGLLALLHIMVPTCLVRSVLVGSCWFAMSQGVLALLGLTFFFRRFTISRTS